MSHEKITQYDQEEVEQEMLGHVKIARMARENPENLDFPRYSLPVSAEDYPAKTPIMWNRSYQEFDLDAGNIMLVVELARLEHVLVGFRKNKKYIGGGVGVGLKEHAVEFLDDIDPIAKAIGAVNFVHRLPDGKLKGYNTDGIGYALSLEQMLKEDGRDLQGAKVVLLGAGGTANAVAFALADRGAVLSILNRTEEKAVRLAKHINEYFGDARAQGGGEERIEDEANGAVAVINASTKGATGEFRQFAGLAPAQKGNLAENLSRSRDVISSLSSDTIVSDVILVGEDTPTIKLAKELGRKTLDGIPMVVLQGVEAFMIAHGDEIRARGYREEKVRDSMFQAARA